MASSGALKGGDKTVRFNEQFDPNRILPVQPWVPGRSLRDAACLPMSGLSSLFLSVAATAAEAGHHAEGRRLPLSTR